MTADVDRHWPEPGVLGYLDGRPLPRARLDGRLARLRSGARAAVLPTPGSSEDRQLARWLAQVILTEELCVAEAARLGLAVVGPAVAADDVAAVELGSILAAAWANAPAVRAVFHSVTATVGVDESAVRAYWRANASALPDRWLLRHRLNDGPAQPLGPVGGEELPSAMSVILDSASVGTAFEVDDALGKHTVIVDAHWPGRDPDYDVDAPGIREQLLASARRKAFVRWCDAARAARVVNVAGLEHPGDPDQPDNHHQH